MAGRSVTPEDPTPESNPPSKRRKRNTTQTRLSMIVKTPSRNVTGRKGQQSEGNATPDTEGVSGLSVRMAASNPAIAVFATLAGRDRELYMDGARTVLYVHVALIEEVTSILNAAVGSSTALGSATALANLAILDMARAPRIAPSPNLIPLDMKLWPVYATLQKHHHANFNSWSLWTIHDLPRHDAF